MFQTEVVEKTETDILFSKTFFPENRDVYEIMWKNIVELGMPQMTIWRMRMHSGYLRLETQTQTM